MVTKIKLQTEQSFDGIIIGVVSQDPDYKLAVAINRKLRINMSINDPVILKNSENQDITFSRFSYFPGDYDYSFELVSNRCGNLFLIKKLINIDFLFLIHNFEDELDASGMVDRIKDIPSVRTVFVPDVSSIKDKNLQLLNI